MNLAACPPQAGGQAAISCAWARLGTALRPGGACAEGKLACVRPAPDVRPHSRSREPRGAGREKLGEHRDGPGIGRPRWIDEASTACGFAGYCPKCHPPNARCGRNHGFFSVIAPAFPRVRPNLKFKEEHLPPLNSMAFFGKHTRGPAWGEAVSPRVPYRGVYRSEVHGCGCTPEIRAGRPST